MLSGWDVSLIARIILVDAEDYSQPVLTRLFVAHTYLISITAPRFFAQILNAVESFSSSNELNGG